MRIQVEEFVEVSQNIPVLDVRSPGEFHKGHIPGAYSFPLFSDTERAEIGTLYKQVGQEQAMERGLEIVSPKIKDMVVEAKDLAHEGRLMVHCWRGGLRSESVANLLKVAGIQVNVLNGGYKAYRQWVLGKFEEDFDIRVLGGMTGSGKTEVLHQLLGRGEAVIDLEAIANHRGSAFGRLGLSEGRITQAQFENEFANQLLLNKGRTIWMEDESRQIGSLIIPGSVWEQMLTAPFFFLDATFEYRVARLLEDYGHFQPSQIEGAIDRIKKRLGGLRHQQATTLLEQDEREDLVKMLLGYYDQSYRHSMQQRSSDTQIKIDPEVGQLPEQLIALAEQKKKDPA